MRYRERTLIHWTGRDLASYPLKPSKAEIPNLITRVNSILRDGLWLTPEPPNPEPILGGQVHTPWKPGEKLYLQADEAHTLPYPGPTSRNTASVTYHPRTFRCCFTEIPLRTALHHAKRYGPVGIGIDRSFLLDRWGAPVQYVRNHIDEVIVWQHSKIHTFLSVLAASPPPGLEEDARQALRAHNYLIQFLKPMSPPATDTFEYLEEGEWRIVWTRSKLASSLDELGKTITDGPRQIPVTKHFIDLTTEIPPRYLMPLTKDDVQVIIVPDDATYELLLNDSQFHSWLVQSPEEKKPYILTLDMLPGFEMHESG